MSEKLDLVPPEIIEQKIFLLRGQRVMLDADLAELYGVTTKRLNEQVKRNRDRFPPEFMFQLSREEKDEVVANCDHLKKIKYSSMLPYAFAEHGALMLASVLSSSRAVEVSIYVVKVFVKLREMLNSRKDLARKLEELEFRIQDHDESIQSLVQAIRKLMAPVTSKSRKIGFRTVESENRTPIES